MEDVDVSLAFQGSEKLRRGWREAEGGVSIYTQYEYEYVFLCWEGKVLLMDPRQTDYRKRGMSLLQVIQADTIGSSFTLSLPPSFHVLARSPALPPPPPPPLPLPHHHHSPPPQLKNAHISQM